MIYLNREAQKRALGIFHFALKPSALLFLGSSESLDEGSALFSAVDKRHRIYVQCPAQRAGLPAPAGAGTLQRALEAQERAHGGPVLPGRAFVGEPSSTGPVGTELARSEEGVSPAELHFKLIERFAPPSVLVNRDYQIVHLSENAGRFLQFSGGEPTTNLLRVVHPNLRIGLRTALFQAVEANLPVEVSHVPVEIEGAQRLVDIRVSPAPEAAPGFLIVVFDGREPLQQTGEENIAQLQPRLEPEPIVRQLEREIESLKSRLRDTVEQYEAGAEEQKASNEELQAMNEELRSASEELETSREELQSINEELATVNQELKSKVEELGQTNSDLHNLMASTAIATIFLDRDFRIMRYTPSAVSLFNLIPGDIGRPLGNLASELEYLEMIADTERVLKDLVPVEREVRAGGHWFLTRVLPYRTLDDHIAGVVLTFVDITDRKHIEEALRESEEQFRRAIEDAPIPMIMQAEDGQVLQISNTWTELTGCTREEIPTFEAWLNHAYGSGAEVVREHMRKLFQGEMPQLEVEIEVNTRTSDTRTWAFSASAPGTLRDGRRFIVGMALDISERKKTEGAALRESEERLGLIVENAREYAIFAMDLDRRITSWNSGARRILGYRQEEALGQSADIIFTPEDRAMQIPEREADKALADGRASDERWHLRKDGSRFWGSGVMMAMHDAQGVVIGLVKIFRDHTERLEAKTALERSLRETEQARAEAEAAGKAKDHFLAVLSHELRTPLTPVFMCVDTLMLREDVPVEVVEALEMIKRSVRLESQLIDDLLDVTRISRGKLELSREPMDLHHAVRLAAEIVMPDMAGRTQRLNLALDANAHELSGDFKRLQQVFWNLLKNASKFTPEGGEIAIRSRNEPGSSNEPARIVVEVTDTGIGFNAGAPERIFEAFTQANEAIIQEYGGLGLGLAIARAVVKAHDGEIRGESAGHNQGATFTVRLPLSRIK
jgi:two-component system, chemotaxis family, CheB/CheR fusion protein